MVRREPREDAAPEPPKGSDGLTDSDVQRAMASPERALNEYLVRSLGMMALNAAEASGELEVVEEPPTD